MKHKCEVCNGCLTATWIVNKRYFHCWFCRIYYDIVDKKMVKIDIETKLRNKETEDENHKED
jgi:hypothetical protein